MCRCSSLPSLSLPSPIPAPTSRRLGIFSSNANPILVQEISCYLGLELRQIKIERFVDGGIYVQLEESVHGCDVFQVQPTCPPSNENLMELLIMIDACRRASAKNINAGIPYFGYARADKKVQGARLHRRQAGGQPHHGGRRPPRAGLRTPLGSVHRLLRHPRGPRVHSQPIILDYLASKTICPEDVVVVSPDMGGVARPRAFAKKLSDAPLAIVDKRRPGHNQAEVVHLIDDVRGKVVVMLSDAPLAIVDKRRPGHNQAEVVHLIHDVRGKVVVMVDGMINTTENISKGAELLHKGSASCVHLQHPRGPQPTRAPEALQRPLPGGDHHQHRAGAQLTVLSVANLLGETIWRGVCTTTAPSAASSSDHVHSSVVETVPDNLMTCQQTQL
jgi:ribose-phosphate pyrophosphokinase